MNKGVNALILSDLTMVVLCERDVNLLIAAGKN